MKQKPKFEASGTKGVLYMYGEIAQWNVSAAYVRNQLEAFSGSELEVRIDSPGGDIIEGISIFNAIRAFKGSKTAIIDGIAMSAASYIMLICDTIKAPSNALIMIHNVWTAAAGNSDELRKIANDMDLINGIIIDAYAKRTGKGKEEIKDLMDAESFFTATEAKEIGLIDEIISDTANAKSNLVFAACARADGLKKSQEFLIKNSQKPKPNNSPKGETKPMKKEEIIENLKTFSESLEGEEKTNIETVIAAIEANLEDKPDTTSAEGDDDPEKEKNKEEGDGVNDKTRRESILAYANANNKDGILSDLLVSALAGDMSLETFKASAKAVKTACDAIKGDHARRFLPGAKADSNEEIPAPRTRKEARATYDKLNGEGRRVEAKAYFTKHKHLI